ncbi:hypothetical protein Tco_1398979 [Tanacetum coccineum]
MLVQFMLCFEAAMEKQRYTQCIADNRAFDSTPVTFTALPIERHACQVYSRSIFREVQKEIFKGLHYCSQISANSQDGSKVCVIRQTNKSNETVLNVKVVISDMDSNDKLVKDGEKITIEYCVNRLRNDPEKLTEFLAKVNDLKKNLDADLPLETHKPNNEDVFQKLLGVTTPNEVVVKVPKGIRNKGCGTGGARMIVQGKEKVIEESEDEEEGNENETSDHATSDTE